MAFQPIPHVARLTVRFQGPQLQTMSFGTYWTTVPAGPWSALQVDGLAGDGDTTFHDIFLAGALSSRILYVGCEARSLDSASAPQAFHGENSGMGGHSGVLLPLEVAAVWSLRTGLTGRSHRNRVYWPALTTDVMEDTGTQGLFKPGFVASHHTLLLNWQAAMEAGGAFKQVVASPKLGTYDPLATSHVDVKPASQRRREG